MKTAIKILIGLLVILVALFAVLELSLDKIVHAGFNAAAPAALGVKASLDGAKISLVRGEASLSGLHIGNPEGFKTDGLFDLASASVHIDNSTLLSDTIVIKEIAIDGLVVTYEKGLLNSNLGALIDSLSSGKEEKPAQAGAAGEKPKEEKAEKPAKKVIIEKLSITGSKMNFSITGVSGKAMSIPLPAITLTDLGKDKEGVTPVEAIQDVLKAIAGAAGTAIAGSADLLGQGLGTVADNVGDAGKAVMGGAAEAGKAAANALKSINPFGK
jgi:hypothetical protein